MKDHTHTRRLALAVKLVPLLLSEKAPTAAKRWIIRALKQEYDEIAYLLAIANKPEGIKVKRT